MISRIQRISPAGCLGLTVVMLTGCALERSSLSIDSGSRMPWLGLQFKPSPNKDTESYHRSIAENRSNRQGEAVVEPAVRPTKTELRLPNWFGTKAEPTGAPLPRTDVTEEGAPQPDSLAREASSVIEF